MKKAILLIVLLIGMIGLTFVSFKRDVNAYIVYDTSQSVHPTMTFAPSGANFESDYQSNDDGYLTKDLSVMSNQPIVENNQKENIFISRNDKEVSYSHMNKDNTDYGINGIPFTYKIGNKSNEDKQYGFISISSISTLSKTNSVKNECHPIKPPKPAPCPVPVGDGLGILTIFLAIYTSFKFRKK